MPPQFTFQKPAAPETIVPPSQTGTAVSEPLAASAVPDENTVALLLETAENAEQKRRIVNKVAEIAALICLVGAVLTLVSTVIRLFHLHVGGLDAVAFAAFVVGAAITVWFGQSARRESLPVHRLHKAAAELLQFPDDPRLLLPLVDALHGPRTPEWQNRIYPLLTERLWNLSATDAALSLDAIRRATLHTLLSDINHRLSDGTHTTRAMHFNDAATDLAVALLKTLAGMGDPKSVKVLEKIIKARASTPNETVVSDAAREYLPVLMQKIAENKAVQKKLRECLEEFVRDPQTVLAEFLDTLDPEKAKSALVEFIREQQLTTVSLVTYISGGFSFAGLASLLVMVFVGFGQKGMLVPILFLGVYGIGLRLLFNAGGNFNRQNRKMACELNRRNENDLRLLPILLDYAKGGTFYNGSSDDDAIKKSLVRLLPLLKPGDAALVPPTQRAYLRSWLKRPRSKKKAGQFSQTVTITALDALVALGDTKALPATEKIACQTVRGTYRETELHEAAVRCVEALRARQR